MTRQARKIFKGEKYTAAFDLLILSAAPTSLRLPRTELFQGVFLEASDTMQMLIVSPALMLHGVNVGFVDIEKVKKRVRRILSKIGLRFEDFRLQVCEVRKDIFGVRCDDYHAAFADYCLPGFTVGGWKFKTSIYFNGEGETIVRMTRASKHGATVSTLGVCFASTSVLRSLPVKLSTTPS